MTIQAINNNYPQNKSTPENLTYHVNRHTSLAGAILLQQFKVKEQSSAYNKTLNAGANIHCGQSNSLLYLGGKILNKTKIETELIELQEKLNNDLASEVFKEKCNLSKVIDLLQEGAEAEHKVTFLNKDTLLSEVALLKGDYELARLLIANSDDQKLLRMYLKKLAQTFEMKNHVKETKDIINVIKKLWSGMPSRVFCEKKKISALQRAILENHELFDFFLEEVSSIGTPKELTTVLKQAIELHHRTPLFIIRKILGKGAKLEKQLKVSKVNNSSQLSQNTLTVNDLCQLAASPNRLNELYHHFVAGIPQNILNGYNDAKSTPLGSAIEAKNFSAAYYLCKAGADINKPYMAKCKKIGDQILPSKLGMAMCLPIVRACPDDVSVGDGLFTETVLSGCWKTAILLASMRVKITPEIARHNQVRGNLVDLVKLGAKPNQTMLDLSMYSKTENPVTEWLDLLICNYKKSKKINPSNKDWKSFLNQNLLRAVRRRTGYYRNAEVQLYLRHGADIDVLDDKGRSPIMLAASSNDLHLVKLFCEKGAKLDIPANNKYTALAMAIKNRNKEMLKALLKKDRSIIIKDPIARREIYRRLVDDNPGEMSFNVAMVICEYGYRLNRDRLKKLQQQHPQSSSVALALEKRKYLR